MRDLFLRIARHWGRQWRKQAPRPCSSCARHSDRCGTLWSKGTPGGPKPGRVRVRVGPARPQRHLHAAAWYSAGNSRREFALRVSGFPELKGPSDATSHPETMLVHLAPFALLKGGCVPAVTRRRAQHRRTVPVCKGGRAASRSAVVVGGRRLAAGNGGDLPLPGGSAEAPCAVWLQCAPHGAFASALGKLPFSRPRSCCVVAMLTACVFRFCRRCSLTSRGTMLDLCYSETCLGPMGAENNWDDCGYDDTCGASDGCLCVCAARAVV